MIVVWVLLAWLLIAVPIGAVVGMCIRAGLVDHKAAPSEVEKAA